MHDTRRQLALVAGGLGLVGIVVALVASPRNRGPRLVTAVGALLNLGTIPVAIVVGMMSHPRKAHFIAPALDEVRAVLAAQETYRRANGGFFRLPALLLDASGRMHTALPSRWAALPRGRVAVGAPALVCLRAAVRPSTASTSGRSLSNKRHVLCVRRHAGRPFELREGGHLRDSKGVICWTTDGTSPQVAADGTCVLGRCHLVE